MLRKRSARCGDTMSDDHLHNALSVLFFDLRYEIYANQYSDSNNLDEERCLHAKTKAGNAAVVI